MTTSVDAGAEAPVAMRPTSILIVDDEASVRRTILRTLRPYGYQVTTAESAEEALDLLAASASAFDLLISDVIMNGLSGIAFSDRLRRLGCRTPIILITGYPGTHLTESIFAIERLLLLAKPFTPSQLRAEVVAALALADNE